MTTIELLVQHTSLQAPQDTPKMKAHDVEVLFTHGQNRAIKTGTEAGQDPLRSLLENAAEEHNHVIHFAADTWIAVDRAIIKPRTIERDHIFVASNDEMVGHGTDRKIATLSFEHVNPYVGRINQAAVHFATRGREPGEPNYRINLRATRLIDAWMKEKGKGSGLAFINGDFNIPDRTMDWAMGGHYTSMADELDDHQNTGHGSIDGFCSYDLDGRVKAKPGSFRVLDDKELFMFSDHYYCLGAWEITLRKRA